MLPGVLGLMTFEDRTIATLGNLRQLYNESSGVALESDVPLRQQMTREQYTLFLEQIQAAYSIIEGSIDLRKPRTLRSLAGLLAHSGVETDERVLDLEVQAEAEDAYSGV